MTIEHAVDKRGGDLDRDVRCRLRHGSSFLTRSHRLFDRLDLGQRCSHQGAERLGDECNAAFCTFGRGDGEDQSAALEFQIPKHRRAVFH